jgi:hypothetical protein
MIKSERMKGFRHVACVGEMRSAYRILIDEPVSTDGQIILK